MNQRVWHRPGLVAVLLFALPVSPGCGDEVPRYAGGGFTSDPPRPGPLNGTIVTTNSGDDTLSAFDPLTGAVRWQFPIGFVPVELEGPHHIAADPTGAFIYVNLSEAVAGSGSGPHGSHGGGTIPGHVLKLRTSDGSLAASVRVDNNPGDAVLSADGSTLYVTHYDLNKWVHAAHGPDIRQGDSNVAIIDTATMTVRRRVPICPAAHGAQLSPDGKLLYASCGPDEIAVVNVEDPALPVTRVLLPGGVEGAGCLQCPYAVGVAPDGLVWVSSLGKNGGSGGEGGVHIYDPAGSPRGAAGGFDPQRHVNLCGRALFPAFQSDPSVEGGYRAFVPEQGRCGDWIRVYRPAGPGLPPVVEEPIALPRAHCLNAHALMLAAEGQTAYVVCEGDHVGPGSLVTIDLSTSTVTGSVPLGVFPDGLALIPTP
jgi:hypothetical protein